MSVIQYKCPNCGGPLTYNPSTGTYKCDYCLSDFKQDALDAMTKEKVMESTSSEGLKGAVIYNCPSCGAEVITDANTAATFCYYCHNPVVLSERLDGTYTPDYIIPFKVDRTQALKIFSNWMSKKKFVPKSFYNQDQIDKLTGVYFPYMLCTCNIGAHVDGIGTKTTISRIGSQEVTEVSKYHIKREGNMETKNVMRNALSTANAVLAEGILPYNLDDMKTFNMSYLSGFFAQKRNLGQEDLKAGVEQEVLTYATDKLRTEFAGYQGLTISNDNISLAGESWKYALLPIWTLTYKESGSDKVYYFSINGENGKVTGVLPVDKAKLILTGLAIFAGLAAVLLLAAYFI